jgi:polysaccharide export outer membrane protein
VCLAFLFIAGSLYSQNSSPNSGVPSPEGDSLQLQAGDVISIKVFNEPDLAVQQEIDPNGVVIIPLLGRTKVAGRNLRDAESFLEQRFIDEEYLIHPQVTVTIVQHAEQVFYVFGEVNNPGAKTFPSGRSSLDILEAITLAGDLSQYAKRSEIVIRRPIPDTNQEEKFTVDLNKVIRGSNRGKNKLFQVQPQDIVFVPERLF